MISETTLQVEVVAVPHRATAAALSLQRLGFRIVHLGASVQVEGTRDLFLRTFGEDGSLLPPTLMELIAAVRPLENLAAN